LPARNPVWRLPDRNRGIDGIPGVLFVAMTSIRHEVKLITAEQLYELSDDGLNYELLRGTLVSEPVPGRLHGRTVARISKLLSIFVDSRRLGVVYTGDTGFVLARQPDTVRGPDVAFMTNERERETEGARPYIPGAPDLAVEIVSPSDRTREVLGKVSDYLAAGSRIVWVVNPVREEVSVFRSPFAPRVLASTDLLDGEDVLPGFSVTIAEIFEN
jgi:Uma2 family endonuclease